MNHSPSAAAAPKAAAPEPVFTHHAMVISTELVTSPAVEFRVATRIGMPWPSAKNAWVTVDAGACTTQSFLSPAACRTLAAGLLQAAQHLEAAAVADRMAANLTKVAP